MCAVWRRAGSIPARAGEPTSLLRHMHDHRGLSPRVRGSPYQRGRLLVNPGSIPARAGEPYSNVLTPSCARVYPRACGGARFLHAAACDETGLSPRVRGSPHLWEPDNPNQRSIPARAGEPPRDAPTLRSDRVYPRACGGAPTYGNRTIRIRGLSPRVRGSLPDDTPYCEAVRSIPARAGEPDLPQQSCVAPRVYPRACGGAMVAVVAGHGD